jgi:hypothetical protein
MGPAFENRLIARGRSQLARTARHAGRVLGKPQRPANVNGLKIRGIKVLDLHVDTIKAKAREFRQATRCEFSALNVSSAWQRFRLAPAIPRLQAPKPALLLRSFRRLIARFV